MVIFISDHSTIQLFKNKFSKFIENHFFRIIGEYMQFEFNVCVQDAKLEHVATKKNLDYDID